jgi:hypothetical protein
VTVDSTRFSGIINSYISPTLPLQTYSPGQSKTTFLVQVVQFFTLP